MRPVAVFRGRGVVLAAKKHLDDGGVAVVVAPAKEWRKLKLDQLENRFAGSPSSPGSLSGSSTLSSSTPPSRTIDSDDDLQQAWRDLESRIRGRRPLSLADRGGVSGRSNVRRTDEDVWLEEGLYEDSGKVPSSKGDVDASSVAK
jgi:hypothetical protein